MRRYKKTQDLGPSVAGASVTGFSVVTPRYSNRLSYDELIDRESALGRTLFGPVPEGHRREFFEQKRNVWVWYEGWHDVTGALQEMTVRYEVRPEGVFKKMAGRNYEQVVGAELENFRTAARRYLQLVKTELYC